MPIKVKRWNYKFEPNETTLRRMMDSDSLRPYKWSNAPNDVYHEHEHSFEKVLVVVRGNITFHTPDGDVMLNAGDQMILPARIAHAATVGEQGVCCLEAHRPYHR